MIQRLKLAAAWQSFAIALFFGVFVLPSNAQSPNQVASRPQVSGPYTVGERLTFNISFSNFISAAHVELLVASRGTFFGREGVQLKGHAETRGVVSTALWALNNDYVTYVDPSSGLPYHSQQIVRDATRILDTSADFNQVSGNAALSSHGAGDFSGIYDFLSGIYRLRALPLQAGSSYYLTVRGQDQTYEIEVNVVGRETIKTNSGSFHAVFAQVHVKNDSQANGYGTRIYFSDDLRHLPLLITAKVSAGEIRAELASSAFINTSPVVTPADPLPTPAGPPVQPVANPLPPVSSDRDLDSLPFKVGEQLNYQVFLPTIKLPVAMATFHVRAHSKYFDHDGLWFTVNAQTTNALQHLFFASDTLSSYTDPKTLLPFHTDLDLKEGRLRASTKLVINQDYGTATTDKGVRIEIPVGTHDYLSFFYALRTIDLTPPRRTAVSILVNNKPKTLFIGALKKETIQLGSQTIPAIQLSLTTDDAQSDKFQLRAWISDDRRRLPLRLTALTELGAIRADLAIIPVTRQ